MEKGVKKCAVFCVDPTNGDIYLVDFNRQVPAELDERIILVCSEEDALYHILFSYNELPISILRTQNECAALLQHHNFAIYFLPFLFN